MGRRALTDPSAILSTLGSGKYQGAEYRTVARFLNADRHDLQKADYRTSILILRQDKSLRFGAALTLSHEIEHLPMIMRTGNSVPWMSGEALRLSSTIITDPLLQRIGSLHICDKANHQDDLEFIARLGALYNNNCPTSTKHSAHEYFLYQRELIAKRLERPQFDIRRIMDIVNRLWSEISGKDCPYIEHPDEISDLGLRNHIAEFYDLLFASASARINSGQRHLNNSRFWPLQLTKTIEHMIIQGLGDLSMNAWNVAYYPGIDGKARLFYPQFEPILSRGYHCLIKWQATEIQQHKDYIKQRGGGICLGDELAIARLRLFPDARLVFDGAASVTGIEKDVEFAIYGKPVLWEGRVLVPDGPNDIITEFSDLRHVFALPDLNQDPSLPDPDFKQDPSLPDIKDNEIKGTAINEKIINKFKEDHPDKLSSKQLTDAQKFFVDNFDRLKRNLSKPRLFFGVEQEAACWLLERELLRDPKRGRAKEAARGPIIVPLADLGAQKDWIHYRLLEAGYVHYQRPQDVAREGEFAWDASAGQVPDLPDLRIYLKRATYPCTLIGIGTLEENRDGVEARGEGNALYMLAWGHDFKYANHSIWDCAEVLRAAGAKYALCMDEGQDVFQCFIPSTGDLGAFMEAERKAEPLDQWMKVPISTSREGKLNRRALRASIMVWQEPA